MLSSAALIFFYALAMIVFTATVLLLGVGLYRIVREKIGDCRFAIDHPIKEKK